MNGYFRVNKAALGIISLLILAGIIIVASYQFSVKTHREVVEHRPPVPDIPGALFYDIHAAGSDEGKAFIKYMKSETRHIEMPTFHMDITLNSPQYFRLLAMAEAKPGEDRDKIYQTYKDRFDFENKVVFTIMMHSAAGHLFDYKLERFTVLRSNDMEYGPAEWTESNRSSDYHRRGMLIFKGPSPGRDIRLVFKDPSGYGKDKILEWKG